VIRVWQACVGGLLWQCLLPGHHLSGPYRQCSLTNDLKHPPQSLNTGLCTFREAPSGCPPAPLPRPLRRTPLLLWVPVACNLGRAVPCGAPARRGGRAREVYTYSAQARIGTPRMPPPTSTCVSKAPSQTYIEAKRNRGRGWGRQQSTRWSGAHSPTAPFAKPDHCLGARKVVFPANLAS